MEPIQYQKTNVLPLLIKPIFYIAALLFATWVVLKVEKLKPSDMGEYQKIFQKEMIIERGTYYPVRRTAGALSAIEESYAQTAWKYFENNYIESSGLLSPIPLIAYCTLSILLSYTLYLALCILFTSLIEMPVPKVPMNAGGAAV